MPSTLERVMRYDKVEVRAQKNDSGFIFDKPILTRTGVFVYKNPDGSERREYRPPEVVFAADSLAAYKGLPITNGHPGKVNAKNVRATQVGTVMSPGERSDETDVVAEIVIHDPTPVEKEGKKELSVGYEVAFDETPGVSPEGERYDAKQISVKPNHLALCLKGRAGTARLNLDAADAVFENEEEPIMPMVKVTLDNGLAYDAAPEVDQEVKTLRAALAAANTARDQAQARADSLDADKKKLEADAVKLQQDAVDAARVRLGLEAAAAKSGVKFKADSTDRELREAIIRSVRGADFNMDGKSDDYVAAAYDMAMTEKSAASENLADNRRKMNQDEDGGAPSAGKPGERSASAAREAYRARLNGQEAA